MDKTESTRYETPEIIASLDALGMLADADGAGTLQTACTSHCLTNEVRTLLP